MAKTLFLHLKEERKSDVLFYVPRDNREDLDDWAELKISKRAWQELNSPLVMLVDLVAGDPVPSADINYRDAGTGQYVSEEYADANPETTVGEAL